MIDKDQLTDFLKDHTNQEAAKHFGINIRTVARWRVKFGLSHEFVKYNYPSFTDQQSDILNSCLLGDGSLDKYGRFKIGQSEAKKEYVEYLFACLKPYSSSFYFNEDKLGNSWRFCTTTHSQLKSLRQKWYQSRKKQVPRDLKLTPFVLAHWILQDGTNNQLKKSITISTDCFSIQDVEFLIELLSSDLGISSSLNYKKDYPNIYIGSYEYMKLINIVSPFVLWECFKYKIDISNVKTKINENLGSCKLNENIAKEIRSLHQSQHSVKDIAQCHGVTMSAIYNILNHVSYPNKKEVADVKMIYNC